MLCTSKGRFFAALPAALALAALALGSCAGLDYSTQPLKGAAPAYPDAHFAVVSDDHYFDHGLCVAGPAFDEYLKHDRKLLAQSPEILDEALARVKASGANFLLISGDLTKDGEEIDHLAVAARLAEFRKAGIRAYVVPGNHDVLNPESYKYEGDKTSATPNVSPQRFAEIYAQDGYGDAIARDPASLSYVAEPSPGLWLLALDACRYMENPGKKTHVVGGAFSQQTLDWVKAQLTAARAEGKAVIVMMHHGVLEHYKGQKKFFGEYVVDGWEGFSKMLAASGVRFAFTGHYHAQDITGARYGADWILDVETGSLVSYPNPIRYVRFQKGIASIATDEITSIASLDVPGKNFGQLSAEFTRSGITGIAIETMKGMGISEGEAVMLSGSIADAFLAHYKGDERFTGKEVLPTDGLSFMGGLVIANKRELIENLWKDLSPADRNLSFDILKGNW
jgi:hypothetical protein